MKFPGMYAVTIGGKTHTNLQFAEAMQKIQHAFEHGKDQAELKRQS